MSRVLPRQLVNFARSPDGATAIEYGMIAALIAAVIVGGVGTLGSDVGTMYNNVVAALPN